MDENIVERMSDEEQRAFVGIVIKILMKFANLLMS